MWSLLARFLPSIASLGSVRGLIAVAAVAASVGGWMGWKGTAWYYRSQEVSVLEATVSRLKADLAQLDTLLAKQAQETEQRRMEADAWSKRWENAKRNEDVQAWADAPVPATVADRLRELSNGR